VYITDYPVQDPPNFPDSIGGVKEETAAKAALDERMKEYLDARQAYLHPPDKNAPKYV